MHILLKITICSLAALIPAAVNAHSARAAERVLTEGVAANSVVLGGIHGLVALTVILITAFRMEICRALNQAIFLWTAQPHGVPVVASGYRRRRRRRSSRWTWKSRSRGLNWSPGSRPSRRRSRRRSHSRRRTAERSHSNGSAAPRYRRGGREYVVADVVFTHGGSVYGSAPPPAGGLLTFSND